MKVWQWHENVLYTPELREEAHEWCNERDLPHTLIPISGWLYEDGDKVHVITFVKDEDKEDYVQWDSDTSRPVMVWAEVDGPLPPTHLLHETSFEHTEDWLETMLGVTAE